MLRFRPPPQFGAPKPVPWPWDARFCTDPKPEQVAHELKTAEQAYRIAMSRPDRRKEQA